MFGVAERMNRYLPNTLYPLEREGRETALAAVRATLGEARMAALWADGKAMASEAVVDYALETPPCSRSSP